ncbi:hypothetical protein GLAREA_00745 [Glarea lozoyensis ATCC 20868]|uniref:Uncharacterized protein n=1 Tax=Glarea lozoyensis (strain ATCC 20868 / MF5171) TaxID=1116229 RepID=S3CV96_GLAL2|nr:uncharacterized protein GLAREA_00745 [Glarea lozoyensis ATCC 20868]EPE29585.1 hypothetical protein GLAREA_00745 [Glarea lozoyensis ATCC 20868]
MPGCSPACRRAVQSNIAINSTPLWISDDALSQAFQRFVRVSHAARRHGSFVPGPLEARRRLGKRRMAYASESTPAGPFNLGWIWDILRFLREKDRTKFTYEAPTPRSDIAARTLDESPDWLSKWFNTDLPVADTCEPGLALDDTVSPTTTADLGTSNARDMPSDPALQPATLEEVYQQKVLDFRASLTSTREDKGALFEEFRRWIYLSVSRGELRQRHYKDVMSVHFMRDIRRAFQSDVEANKHFLLLFRAIWKGSMDSEGTRSRTDDGSLMDRLLSSISNLSLEDENVQALAVDVIRSLSEKQMLQLRNRKAGFHQLVNTWTRTWINCISASSDNASTKLASDNETLDSSYSYTYRLLQGLSDQVAGCQKIEDPTRKRHIVKSLEATLGLCKTNLAEILRQIELREDELSPFKVSVAALSHALAGITGTRTLNIVVQSCLSQVLELCADLEGDLGLDLRCAWMSIIASMPSVNGKVFRKSWEMLNLSSVPDQEGFIVDMLQRHWKSRGYLDNADLTRNAFLFHSTDGGRSVRSFLQIASKWELNEWKRTKRLASLVCLLANNGHPRAIVHVVSQLRRDSVHMPANIITSALRALAVYKPKVAFEAYYMCVNMPSGTTYRKSIKLDRHAELVLSLIRHTSIPPNIIWEAMGVPIYSADVPRAHWPKWALYRKGGLPPQTVELIGNMAMAFANSERTSSRVALRNVTQCLNILVVHNAPIPVNITKAITIAGLTRPLIENKGLVSLERLKWALPLIERAEGTEVAESVDEIIYEYRSAFKRLRAERTGRFLPLR